MKCGGRATILQEGIRGGDNRRVLSKLVKSLGNKPYTVTEGERMKHLKVWNRILSLGKYWKLTW